jgi:hypothetical protein
MSDIQAVTHGEGVYEFKNRVARWFGCVNYVGKNCLRIVLPPNSEKRQLHSNHPELISLMRKISEHGATEYDLAHYAFIGWKMSPEHNQFILSSRIKQFYLTFNTHEWMYYFELFATSGETLKLRTNL